jgi:hypothetical protein
MKANEPSPRRNARRVPRGVLAVACACLLLPGETTLLAQAPPAADAKTTAAPAEAAAKLPPEQLDSLVAPIALYPDPLLAQTLAASTYPLEIVQLQQWLAKNKTLKDKALADAVAKQPWDPSVQSMAAFPDAVKRLAEDIQWTTDLGNAFLVQQSDVMDAVQRMRKKAKDNNALASSEQQKVETKVIETKEVIVIEPASPQVIYVPSYSPTYVYGPPVYPYPPIYYPPYTPGAAFVGFSMGIMIGAAWGGAWGHCGWGHNDINVNVNNNYNRNANINRNTNVSGNRGSGSSWQHNSQHRGGAPYADKATANKFGGTARGDSASSRQAGAQQQARSGANSANRASAGGASSRSGERAASASSYDRSGSGGGSGDRVGNREVGSGSSRPSSSSSSKGGGLGSSSGYSGSSARSSSSRGSSSYGGGGRSGGGRGGGGGRRR